MMRDGEGASHIEQYGEIASGDLLDLEGLKTLCEGIDTVVHMAGDPDPSATWQSLLDANIIETYTIFVAAKTAGCRRVFHASSIHASSIHAVSGYASDAQVKTSEPVNMGDLYGVSKCYGEVPGRYMAEKEELSVITIRIGAFEPVEKAKKAKSLDLLDAFVLHRDLNQLLNKCVDVENLQFAILHGMSDNGFKRLDISDARELVGYTPEDDATQLLPQLKNLKLSDTLQSHGAIVDGQKSGLRDELNQLESV